MPLFGYITDEGISHLANHRYVAAGYTPLDKLMDPFWLFIANRVPRWISPNVVSLIGGACALTSTGLSIAAGQRSSRPLYIMSGVMLFNYVNADAVDGKHARLTGQTSPLGAFLDHGIDAFVAASTGVAICATVEPSLSSDYLMAGLSWFHTAWFVAQWEMREVGSMDARGVTESEFAAIFVQTLPGIAGLGIFGTQMALPVLGKLTLGQGLARGVCAMGVVKSAFHIITTLVKQQKISSFMPLVHFGVHNVLSIAFARTALFRQSPLISFLMVGMDACLLMTKGAITATTHTPWPKIFPLDGVPFLVVTAAALLGRKLDTRVMLFVLAWQGLVYSAMWRDTISRLCKALNIPFLAEIPPKKP